MNASYRFGAALMFSTLLICCAALGGGAAAQSQNLTLQASMVSAKAGSAVTPYSGTLTISISSAGNITGSYISDSIGYQAAQGHIVTVTGTLHGTKLHLRFGMGGGVQVDGTFINGKMTGTAYDAARQYNFKAHVEK
jgi:hypothetical protein